MSVDRDRVLKALATIRLPDGGPDIVAADMVRALGIEGDTVRFVIEVPAERGQALAPLRAQAEAAVAALPGVGSVTALMTAHADRQPPSLKIGRHPDQRPAGPQPVPGVARIIAVGSGKGGVGKSTLAANLAAALAAAGKRTGLLDGDIYGPSQPRMMGVNARPQSPDGKTILPLHAHGVTMMSIGLMLGEGQSVVWRGPMLMGALQQMLGQVQWGALDVLIVDLPPGTGDVQLTLAQRFEVAGAIIVSTPQDVALIDALKAIDMFRKTRVEILGLVENMSVYICPNCGHEAHLFGHGGVAAEAERQGLPFLGAIPLDLSIRLAADQGAPIVVSHPDSAQARAFARLAGVLIERGIV